jgi:hypothetical protein
MGKRPSKDSFTVTLGQQVAVTRFTNSSAKPRYPERQEVNIVSNEEDERAPVLLASKMVSDYAFE